MTGCLLAQGGERRPAWAFAEGGAGLEFGKLFLQAKVQAPVASNAPTRMPVSFWFKF